MPLVHYQSLFKNKTSNKASIIYTNKNFFTQSLPNLIQVPEVEEDALGPMDTVFVWLRFVHSALVPILIFILHKGSTFTIDFQIGIYYLSQVGHFHS